MSRLIYIVPWAICDTENLYVKRMEQKETVLPNVQEEFDDWTIQSVIPSPDRRSKDVYIILDVYRGYNFENRNRDVAILDITNSVSRLQELGYVTAEDSDREFIRQKVLKWDKPVKKTVKKPTAKTKKKSKESRNVRNKKASTL